MSRNSRRKTSSKFPIHRECAPRAAKAQWAYPNRALESNTETEESQQKKHRGVLFYKRARCIAADPKNIGDALSDRMILL